MGQLSFFQLASTCQLFPFLEPARWTSFPVFTVLGSTMVEKNIASPVLQFTLQPKIEELARSPTRSTLPARLRRYTWFFSKGVSVERYNPFCVGVAATARACWFPANTTSTERRSQEARSTLHSAPSSPVRSQRQSPQRS